MRAVRIETSPFQILSLVEFESILKRISMAALRYPVIYLRKKKSDNGYDIGRNMGTYLVL